MSSYYNGIKYPYQIEFKIPKESSREQLIYIIEMRHWFESHNLIDNVNFRVDNRIAKFIDPKIAMEFKLTYG